MAVTNQTRPEYRWITTADWADAVAEEVHQLTAFAVRRDVTISWNGGTRDGVEFSFVYGGDDRLVNLKPLWAAVERLRNAGAWLEVYDVSVGVLRNIPS